MNRLKSVFVAAGLFSLAFATGCVTVSEGDLTPRERVAISETEITWFPDPFAEVPNPWEELPESRSVLLRTEDEMTLFHDTNTLTPGHIFHFWYGAFQTPGNCEQPYDCREQDLFRTNVGLVSVFGRISARVNDQGVLRWAAKPAFQGEKTYTRFGQGIYEMFNSEVHGFLRDHGDMNEELFEVQRGGSLDQYYDGNCLESGQQGANFECYAPQVARHTPSLAGPGEATRHEVLWTGESDIGAEEPVSGSTGLVASNPNLATGYVHTSGLTPGHAVSLYWVAFGEPEQCAGGAGACTLADIDNEATAPAIVDTRIGDIINEDGELLQSASPLDAELLEPHLIYEVLLVVRDHGAYTDDHYVNYDFNMNDGCKEEGLCTDVQYSRHTVTTLGR